jgi:hypothetical protein
VGNDSTWDIGSDNLRETINGLQKRTSTPLELLNSYLPSVRPTLPALLSRIQRREGCKGRGGSSGQPTPAVGDRLK